MKVENLSKNPEKKHDTLWLFNIAMENGPFIDDFPIEPSIYKGFSMAMLNNQMIDMTKHHCYDKSKSGCVFILRDRWSIDDVEVQRGLVWTCSATLSHF